MLTSFLLPTRGRVARLQKSLDSLARTADDKASYQVIFRVDYDDLQTQDFLNGLGGQLVTVGPRGRGYLDLHLYVNECARRAEGDFLWLWNDDAQMVTQGWDSILARVSHDPPRVYFPPSGLKGRNWFPIVHRGIYERMGRFSESALNDFYMSTVARKAGLERHIDISIFHEHPAFTNQAPRDEIYQEAVIANTVCKHDGADPRILACIDEDVAKLKDIPR